MKSKIVLTLLVLSGAILPTGCNSVTNSPTAAQPNQQQDNSYGYNEPYYGNDYQVWVGPGWYYGIYFSNEGRYRSWHRGRGGHGGHGHYRGGGGHHRGGGHRGGGHR